MGEWRSARHLRTEEGAEKHRFLNMNLAGFESVIPSVLAVEGRARLGSHFREGHSGVDW
jgi:hypothetical protein